MAADRRRRSTSTRRPATGRPRGVAIGRDVAARAGAARATTPRPRPRATELLRPNLKRIVIAAAVAAGGRRRATATPSSRPPATSSPTATALRRAAGRCGRPARLRRARPARHQPRHGHPARERARALVTLAGGRAARLPDGRGAVAVGGDKYRAAPSRPRLPRRARPRRDPLARRVIHRRAAQPAARGRRSCSASSCWPSPSRCWCRARCSARSRASWTPRAGWAPATSGPRCRPRGATSSPRWARSSTRCRQARGAAEGARPERAASRSAMRRLGETFASNLDRDGAARDRRRGRRSTASAPTPAARRARRGRRRRSTRSRTAGDDGPLADAVHAAESRGARDRRAARGDVGEVAALAHPLRADGDGEGALLAASCRGPRAGGRSPPRRARALPLPRGPGRGVDRERRPARDRRAPGGHRRAHRASPTAAASRRRWRPRSSAHGASATVGLVMLDIDDFKLVNDTYGHQAGDLVLSEVARILRETSREIDEPARYGGEELAVVLPGHRPRGRVQPGRARARRDRGAASCRSPTRAAGAAGHRELRRGDRRRARATTRGRWSRRPTRRSTRPSAAARTARSGARGLVGSAPARGKVRPMGLLDDAIREHLELKRRHGADPGEVAEQEHEALGPVRRGEAPRRPPRRLRSSPPSRSSSWRPTTPGSPRPARRGGPSPRRGGRAARRARAGPRGRRRGATSPTAARAACATSPGRRRCRSRCPTSRRRSRPRTAATRRRRTTSRCVAVSVPSRCRPRTWSRPTRSPSRSDVLEETPEFLQETPEHDRLWFEQKPPRDFDF